MAYESREYDLHELFTAHMIQTAQEKVEDCAEQEWGWESGYRTEKDPQEAYRCLELSHYWANRKAEALDELRRYLSWIPDDPNIDRSIGGTYPYDQFPQD